MDSDAVNSIYDSVESQQIAAVIRTAYFDMIQRANLPEHSSLINLTASGDSDKPVVMYIPTNIAKVEWIKYDIQDLTDTSVNRRLLTFLPIQEFVRRMDMLDQTATTTGSFNLTTEENNTFTVFYENDVAPAFWTIFDDRTLIFNSFDSAIETTLQANKTMCYARLIIPFIMEDTFIPDLDEDQFQLLFNEAKSLAWLELKQTQHPKAELNARRGWSRNQKIKQRARQLSDFDQLPHFGRK